MPVGRLAVAGWLSLVTAGNSWPVVTALVLLAVDTTLLLAHRFVNVCPGVVVSAGSSSLASTAERWYATWR